MTVVLDVDRMAVNEHGVKDFAWPLAREEVLAMRDAMLPPLIAVARGSGDANEETDTIRTCLGILINEALSIYQAYAVCRRLDQAGRDLIPPPRSRVFTPVSNGTMPQPSPESALIQTGLPYTRSRARVALGRMKMYATWNGISPGVLRPTDLTSWRSGGMVWSPATHWRFQTSSNSGIPGIGSIR